jgi:hypothetical protein
MVRVCVDVTAVNSVIGCHQYRSVFLLSDGMRVMDERHEGTNYPCTACYLTEFFACVDMLIANCTNSCAASGLTAVFTCVQ